MKTYRITVRREVEQTHNIEVEADNEDDARDQAEGEIDNIADDSWDDGFTTSDPEVTKVVELTDEGEEVTDDGEA